jgi:hypothetical protein
VRTDSNTSKRQEGISFLLIDMKTPGITVRPLILMDGGHEVNEVFFDDVKVPVENLVYEENKGWTVAKYLLGHERMGTGRIGVSKRELVRLKEVAGILATCDLFVGNDSGPMHLAAALRVPTVGIFGPGRGRTTGPVGPPNRVAVIERDYPCAPCRQDFFRECPPAPSGKPFCLEEIKVDEVAQVALSLMASGRASAAGVPTKAPGQPAQP